jgi:hypothetical protein
MLACRAHAGLLARDLLLLQDQGLGLCRSDWLYEIIPLRQPQPGLRHVGKSDPRIAVSELGGHLEALLCSSPILVCPCRSRKFDPVGFAL